jgi:hypothetical protein
MDNTTETGCSNNYGYPRIKQDHKMPKQLPNDITFAEWVEFVFNHPESEEKWYDNSDRDWWDARVRPLLTVQYMTRLFGNASVIFAPFSNLQVQHGLWFIADASCSNHTVVLFNHENGVSLHSRVECINSFSTLYTEVFTSRCSEYLSHNQPTQNSLNLVCYMWWDLLAAHYGAGQPVRRELDIACLHVMSKILEIDSLACRESALHGLGHWQPYYPKKVEAIIRSFLKANPNSDSKLREYALAAQRGHVQ